MNLLCNIWKIGGPRFLFSVLFVFGLCGHFGNCIIEYSAYTDRHFHFVMKVLDVFEDNMQFILNPKNVRVPERDDIWNKVKKTNTYTKTSEVLFPFLNSLEAETQYLLVTTKKGLHLLNTSVDEKDDEDITLPAVKWMIQFLSLEYCILFTQGINFYLDSITKSISDSNAYLTQWFNKNDDLKIKAEYANNVHYLAVYFGMFGTDPPTRFEFFTEFFESKATDYRLKIPLKIMEAVNTINKLFAVLLFGKDSVTRDPDYNESLLWSENRVQNLVKMLKKNDTDDKTGTSAEAGSSESASGSKLIQLIRELETMKYLDRSMTEATENVFEKESSLVLLYQPKIWPHAIQFVEKRVDQKYIDSNNNPIEVQKA